MPRIDLYLLKEANFSAQIAFCCRLCDKAREQHSRIHIQTNDTMQSEALNSALWEFKSDSFIPHDIGQNSPSPASVIIDDQDLKSDLLRPDSLLILLKKELPTSMEKYKRLCLIIPNIEQEIQAARVLFKQLKQKGIEVHIQDMR